MNNVYRKRRTGLAALVLLIALLVLALLSSSSMDTGTSRPERLGATQTMLAMEVLELLTVKGRAPKTGYARSQFGDGWRVVDGCDTRNVIMARDMQDEVVNSACQVMSGILHDPYTGKRIIFERGEQSSQRVQIDHVVALSNAWQTGAQLLDSSERASLANDPLELLAVDGGENQKKSDGDAATWLPPNKSFRCQYIARQIAVKHKYGLWVTASEKSAMNHVLRQCPQERLLNSLSKVML